jgi:hypothetical protein
MTSNSFALFYDPRSHHNQKENFFQEFSEQDFFEICFPLIEKDDMPLFS